MKGDAGMKGKLETRNAERMTAAENRRLGTRDCVICAQSLYKIYRMGDEEVRAVDGIDLSIRKGEFVSILGPSGSGKSTLLQMIGLLDRPTSGKIFIDGRDSAEMDDDVATEFRRKRVGFVFQQFNLISTLNVYENVAVPLMLDEVDEAERMRIVVPLLERLGMEERLAHYPNQISGGQMQRVAIARALVLNPEIILADEPTGNLDSKSGSEIISIFKELNRNGKTVVMITHDRSIARHADRIIYIKDGKIDKTEVVR